MSNNKEFGYWEFACLLYQCILIVSLILSYGNLTVIMLIYNSFNLWFYFVMKYFNSSQIKKVYIKISYYNIMFLSSIFLCNSLIVLVPFCVPLIYFSA